MPAGDYPDWQRYAAWFGSPLVNISGNPPLVLTSIAGLFDVANFKGLLVWFATVAHPVRLQLNWYAGSTTTLGPLLGTRFIEVNTGLLAQQLEPALGTVVDILWQTSVAGAQATVVVTPTNVSQDQPFAPNDGIIQAQATVAVAAGATFNTPLPPYRGPAWVAFRTTGTLYAFQIRHLDLGLAFADYVLHVHDDAAFHGVVLHLPSRILDLQYINNDAAGKTFDYALIARD